MSILFLILIIFFISIILAEYYKHPTSSLLVSSWCGCSFRKMPSIPHAASSKSEATAGLPFLEVDREPTTAQNRKG